MNESLNKIKLLIERYFAIKNEVATIKCQLRDAEVKEKKLSIIIGNREAKVEYLENEVMRGNLLRENRDMIVNALKGHLDDIQNVFCDLKDIISPDTGKTVGIFKAKGKLRKVSEQINRLSEVVEKNILSEINCSEVPAEIDLVQNYYTAPSNKTAVQEKDYECNFLDIGLGAMEMKLNVPQPEWEAVQKCVQSNYGEAYMQYCFGGKIRLLKREEMVHEVNRTSKFLSALKERVSNRKCVIIGNGPSLNKHDFKLMSGNFMIGSNYIFMNHKNMGYYPDLITATNFLVVEQRLMEFLEVPVPKIFPFYMYNVVGPQENVYYLNVNHLPEFSECVNLWASTRSTVTFLNLQIAYFLGCEETYLIGVDNTYQQSTKGEGQVLNQDEDDPNHFSPEYFKGLKWQSADPDNMALVYSLAKKYFDKAGRRISNAGIGGALEVFPRVDYKKVIHDEGEKMEILDQVSFDRVIVSINPDLQGFFGHYYYLDLKMSNVLAKRGDGFVVLAHKSLQLELNSKFPFIVPCFSEQSYVLGLIKVEKQNVEELFIEELERGIARAKQSFPAARHFEFYMYCGAFPHLRAISEVMNRENRKGTKGCRFHVHIFYPSFEKAVNRTSTQQGSEFFSRTKVDSNLLLYTGTEDYQAHIKEIHGVDVRYLPCSSTTFTDEELQNYRNGIREEKIINICFPGNLRPEKGMAVTLEALFEIDECCDFENAQFVVRKFKRSDEEDEVDYYKCLLNDSIHWVEGELSDEEFKDMIANADIVVIPYSKEAFEMRPSGLFADSILLEKPVLVENGTFLASFVKTFGNGFVYEPQNAKDLVSKLKEMLGKAEKLRVACKLARTSWEKENSWRVFYEKLTN